MDHCFLLETPSSLSSYHRTWIFLLFHWLVLLRGSSLFLTLNVGLPCCTHFPRDALQSHAINTILRPMIPNSKLQSGFVCFLGICKPHRAPMSALGDPSLCEVSTFRADAISPAGQSTLPTVSPTSAQGALHPGYSFFSLYLIHQ